MDIPQVDYNKPGSFGSLELRYTDQKRRIYRSKDILHIQPYEEGGCQFNRLLSFPRLDFIKIDVEGMELEVLEGARMHYHNYRPHMLIEWIKTDRQNLSPYFQPSATISSKSA
jgi:hypothetical protein